MIDGFAVQRNFNIYINANKFKDIIEDTLDSCYLNVGKSHLTIFLEKGIL